MKASCHPYLSAISALVWLHLPPPSQNSFQQWHTILALHNCYPGGQIAVVFVNFTEPFVTTISLLKPVLCFTKLLLPGVVKQRVKFDNCFHSKTKLCEQVFYMQEGCSSPLFLALMSLTLIKGGRPVRRNTAWPSPMSSSICL